MARKAPFKERLQRRFSIVSGRAVRTLGTKPKHRSVFLHMPKCGGTSLSEAMYATVPLNERIGVIDAVSTRRATAMIHFGKDETQLCHEDLDTGQLVFDLREAMLLQHMAWDTMLIHGHVFWSEQAEQHFGNSYKYVTLLRDPVERTISNFRMSQRSGVTKGSLDEYLAGPVARRHAQVYLRYLSGRNDIADDEVPAALALAKARLEKFALIGFLHETEAFFKSYAEIFGVRLRMSQLNAAPDRHPGYGESQMAQISALCQPDAELYAYAKDLNARRQTR